MLADTDAGSIITAAQSGAAWGYRLLFLQIILIPVLFIVQELTVRLGILTGRGHGELIREQFGAGWAWLSVGTLLLACLGALVTELSGIAGVGELFGVPRWASAGATVLLLTIVVWSGSYRSVERVAILLGSGELAFVLVAWRAHPNADAILSALRSMPLGNVSLLSLAAANVGAVIMPWMIFYQQSAVIDKGLEKPHLRAARQDTAWGAVLTQVVMAAVLIATAATLGGSPATANLDSVRGIAGALEPYLGHTVGVGLFAVGMTGAALVSAIVVSLTAAWALGEALGYSHSLRARPHESPWFYGVYTGLLIAGALLVVLHSDLVRLTIGVEVLNALLLPIVLGFLYLLARRALPWPYRLRGWYAVLVGVVVFLTSAFAVYAGGIVPLLSALRGR